MDLNSNQEIYSCQKNFSLHPQKKFPAKLIVLWIKSLPVKIFSIIVTRILPLHEL